MTRFGYLGPEGTFTSTALDQWAPAAGRERVPFGSVDAALAALRAGEVDGAMVPIENSVEGGVSATLDALASGDPLLVVGEVVVPVTFVLAAPAGTTLQDVRAVGTHSHAWAQVRGWMSAAKRCSMWTVPRAKISRPTHRLCLPVRQATAAIPPLRKP